MITALVITCAVWGAPVAALVGVHAWRHAHARAGFHPTVARTLAAVDVLAHNRGSVVHTPDRVLGPAPRGAGFAIERVA